MARGLALVTPCVLVVMGSAVLAPVLPAMLHAFRDSPAAALWVPAILTLPALVMTFFAPIAGLLGDRLDRRRLLIVVLMLYSIVGLAPLALYDLPSILAARALLGLCEAGALVLSTALIGDHFDGVARDRWLAGQTIAATVAALVLLPVGGLAGAWFGWRGPFLCYALAAPMALAVWIYTRPVSRMKIANQDQVAWSALPWAWLVRLCVVSLLASVLFYAVQLQIGVALATLGVDDPAQLGWLAAGATLGVPCGALLFTRLRALSFRRILASELLLVGAAMIAMRFAPGVFTFLPVAALCLLGCGMMLPTLLTHVSAALPVGTRGRGLGIWQGVFSAGQFLSGAAIALVIGRGGDVIDAFALLGALGCVAALLIALGPAHAGRFRQNGQKGSVR